MIRQNHLGDWGTPIALVLAQLRHNGVNLDEVTLEDLDTAYREAQANAKADRRAAEATRRFFAGSHRHAELIAQIEGADEVIAAAKQDLVQLQAGDPELHADWRKMIDCTLDAVQETIDLLACACVATATRVNRSTTINWPVWWIRSWLLARLRRMMERLWWTFRIAIAP